MNTTGSGELKTHKVLIILNAVGYVGQHKRFWYLSYIVCKDKKIDRKIDNIFLSTSFYMCFGYPNEPSH